MFPNRLAVARHYGAMVIDARHGAVVERINFTGTEIDLLCEHMDRPGESARR